MEKTLSGEKPDRAPVALWRHFPIDDQSADGLAKASSIFQKQYDFDFIKITPASSFCVSDWGIQDKWNGNTEGTRDYENQIINYPDDWYKIKPLDPTIGSLGRQLECARMLASEFSPETPLIQTIFSPLSQAKNLVGRNNLSTHVRNYPDAVAYGLEQIVETTLRFIDEVKKIHLDGIFFAVQQAQYPIFSLEEFKIFGKKYDLRICSQLSSFWLNVLHLHGTDVMFDDVLDYPVQVINWHDRQAKPSISNAISFYDGVVCGGLSQWETMVKGTPDRVREEATEILEITNHKKFVLGTGCVVPIIAPHGNLQAARESVEY
jgi:uroporphyrinogen decarboxylase